MLNNPRPNRFGVILSGREEPVQNRGPRLSASDSSSRCMQPCQGDWGTAPTHRPYSAEDNPEPGGRNLLHLRAEEPEEKPGGEMCSLTPFPPLLTPPGLTVSRPTPTAGTLGLRKNEGKKGCVQEHWVLRLLSSVLCQTYQHTMLGLLLACSQYDSPQNLNRSEIWHHYK